MTILPTKYYGIKLLNLNEKYSGLKLHRNGRPKVIVSCNVD